MSTTSPGPWSVSGIIPTTVYSMAPDGKRLAGPWIADCWPKPESGELTRQEAEANAHRIAAAPDLEEALELILSDYLETRRDFGYRQMESYPNVVFARAAIAKAKGLTSPPASVKASGQAQLSPDP